jgi:signal transduction histidine kinase
LLNTQFDWIGEDDQIKVGSEYGVEGIYGADIQSDVQQYLNLAKERPETLHFSAPYMNNVTKQWSISIAVGVRNKVTKQYIGTLLVSIMADGLVKRIVHRLGITDMHFMILTNEFHIVWSSSTGEAPHDISYLRNYINFGVEPHNAYAGLIDKPLEYGNTHFFYYSQMCRYPFIILTGYTSSIGSNILNEILLPRLMEFFIIGMLAIILLYLMRKRFINPILSLSKAADEILQGKEGVTIPNSNSREISILEGQLQKVLELIKTERRIKATLSMRTKQLEEAKEQSEEARRVAELAYIEAEEAKQAKSLFMANLAHEIKIPANKVIGHAEYLVRNISLSNPNSPFVQSWGNVAETTYFIKKLVTDLLEYAKSEHDEITLKEMPLDMRRVINYSVDLLQHRATTYYVEVELDIADNLPMLMGDDLRIKQILNNLISNAINYTPKFGLVTISAYIDGDFYLVIKDRGVGIASEELSKIMQPFYVGKNNDPEKHNDNTGLGLPLAKKLVELHNGTLKIESTINVGTEITIVFPRNKIVYQNDNLSDAQAELISNVV